MKIEHLLGKASSLLISSYTQQQILDSINLGMPKN